MTSALTTPTTTAQLLWSDGGVDRTVTIVVLMAAFVDAAAALVPAPGPVVVAPAATPVVAAAAAVAVVVDVVFRSPPKRVCHRFCGCRFRRPIERRTCG